MMKRMLLSLFFLPTVLGAMGGTVPSGYPSTFMMGYVFEAHVDGAGRYVSAGQEFNTVDHYMASIGSGWSATYKYLIGGPRAANGANCWWNAYPGTGGMPPAFMSKASSRSYQPIFIYENMQAFAGNYAGGVYSGFQSSTFMGQYFSDWADLMGVVNNWLNLNPGVVTIDVEPDVWGYMQQAYNSNPASIPASVASATNPGGAYPWVPLTAFPNTVQGVARALLYIKGVKLGANNPRLKLAFHASSWAVSPNPATQQGTVNVASHAASVAGFVNACKTTATAGVDWDLLFLDPADGDAGLYSANGLDAAGTTHWWDSANVTQPTFNRYRDWVDALSGATNLRCMLWQMPIGNQAYKTMNNTAGHYQDNRAEYFLNASTGAANVCDWASKGVLGILWGRGSIIQTGATYTCGTGGPDYWFTTWGTDYSGGTQDNVVNAGTLGVASSSADDDGGYLRARMPAYFSSPCVLPAAGTPTPSGTVSPSASASPTASPSRTPSATRTVTSSPTGTATSTATPSRTGTGSATPSRTPSSTPTATATVSPVGAGAATATPTTTPTSSPSASATRSATLSATPSRTGTVTASATTTRTASPGSTPTRTSTVVTSTATASTTASPSASPSATGSATTTAAPSPTASPSATPSATPLPGSPTSTSSPTISPSATPSSSPSPSPTVTASPPPATLTGSPSSTGTFSPMPGASPTATQTPGPGGTDGDPLELVEAIAWPEPNPLRVAVQVKGRCEQVELCVYTRAMRAVGRVQAPGPAAGGWSSLGLPAELASASNGAYYFTVRASRGAEHTRALKRRLVLAR